MIQEDAHEGMPLLQGMLRLYDDFHSRLAPLGVARTSNTTAVKPINPSLSK